MTSPEVDLIATFDARDGEGDAVASLIADYADVVRAEPGNVVFEVYRERDRPVRFVVVERYVDQAGFEAHLAHPANATFNDALAPLAAGGGSALTFLDRVVAAR